MKRTDIEWTANVLPDGTTQPGLSANPLKYRTADGKVVWACVKHSSGCANCYSEAIAHHYRRGGPFTSATMKDLTPFLDEKDLRQILAAKTIDKRPVAGSKCFLGDMTDVFGEWVPDALLDRLFTVMALRKDVTFQILTKRADRMRAYFDRYRKSPVMPSLGTTFLDLPPCDLCPSGGTLIAPLPNVWLGVSVENQAAADERIPHLLATPAAVRFLSCEPLLGPVDLSRFLEPLDADECLNCGWEGERLIDDEKFKRSESGDLLCPKCEHTSGCTGRDGIDWVIVGGESGHGSRPMQLEWARSLVRQCKVANVAVFVKQLGSNPEGDTFPADERDPATGNRVLHVRQTLTIRDKKGGDIAEFPDDLKIREFPKVPA